MLPDNAAGNTPTCVGKTHASTPFGAHLQKHPHVRGEDLRHQPKQIWPGETPPRAWGRRIDFFTSSSPSRNTPTCVGKTITHFPASSLTGKHPHVRGEDQRCADCQEEEEETPPRAWGRRQRSEVGKVVIGNTPTCVGKTLPAASRHTSTRKHPHVRGEDALQTSEETNQGETPPRAWGRPPEPLRQRAGCRNTPTCVGKTAAAGRMTRSSRKHPHVRGEDTNIL